MLQGFLARPRSVRLQSVTLERIIIVENKTIEFRWENFNAFNHVNLGVPGNTVDVGGAGQITSTANPMRQMQLALHFRF